MKDPKFPSAFALEFLTLLEADVTHQAIAEKPEKAIKAFQRTDVDTSYMTPKTGRLSIYLAVKHVITINNIEVQQTIVRYSAQFRQMGIAKAEELVRFAAIDAPQMIFPFVRDNIALLTASAPSGPVILNEVDFVEICRAKMPRN